MTKLIRLSTPSSAKLVASWRSDSSRAVSVTTSAIALTVVLFELAVAAAFILKAAVEVYDDAFSALDVCDCLKTSV